MDIAAVKAQLKTLKSEKGKIARQFKQVENGSAEHQALIERMQEVSGQVKQLESEQKALLKAQNDETPKADQPPPLPSQFSQPIAHLNSDFTISRVGPDGDLSQWWEYVAKSNTASIYHSQAVWEFLCEQPHTAPEILIARNDKNAIVGGLPLVFMATPLLGTFGVSLPFFNYGGPVTRYTNVFEKLLEVCRTDAKDTQSGSKYTEVRTTVKSTLSASTKKVSMLRPLPETIEQLDEEIGAKVRAQVKKADPYSPKIRFGHKELLDDFYTVFARNMRDLGTPVNSKAFFADLLDKLPRHSHLVVAYVSGKPVATGFLLEHGEMMEIPWASTLREANKMDMNMWLYQRILQFAIKKQLRWFDFGRSTKDAGTYRFKKQWGAQPVQHYWYNFSAQEQTESLNPDNPKFKLAIATWQRLPVWLTRQIGPYLSRQLP